MMNGYEKKRGNAGATGATGDGWPPPWIHGAAPEPPVADVTPPEPVCVTASPDPLAAFLRDPHGTPQEAVDRLIASAHRLDPHLLSSFNVALAWRHGLDPQDVFDACRAFDEPAPLPTEV